MLNYPSKVTMTSAQNQPNVFVLAWYNAYTHTYAHPPTYTHLPTHTYLHTPNYTHAHAH